jgi:hypothetical protein
MTWEFLRPSALMRDRARVSTFSVWPEAAEMEKIDVVRMTQANWRHFMRGLSPSL